MPHKTIRAKLSLFLMATSTVAVLLVGLMFYWLVARQFQMTYQQDLQTLATIVGHTCEAALVFKVPEDAATVLGSLKSRPSIISARLYDQQHQLFASYGYGHRGEQLTLAPGLHEGQADPRQTMTIEQPITLANGTVVGTIVVKDDIRDIALGKQKGLLFLAMAGIIALFATFFLASFLQNIISRPLLALTTAAQRLAAGDFTARHDIQCHSQDEVGMLSVAFVDMSQRLAESRVKLEEYSLSLEKRVVDRTMELQQALDDLTKSQGQLIQSEKMVALGQLVAGVAHEVNNNINFISGAIPSVIRLTNQLVEQCAASHALQPEVYAESEQIAQRIKTLLDNAQTGVQRTAKIVLDLNRFARPSHGRLTRTDIRQELEMVLTLLRYELQDRIQVQLELDPDLPPVVCHQDQINQVYMNILRNAIQAIADTGTIRIKGWFAAGMVQISFQDNGCGIPPAARAKIFDPFFTTKEEGKGTGLGLSISYGIINNHHGEIILDATGNQGTTFIIRIPPTQETRPQRMDDVVDGPALPHQDLDAVDPLVGRAESRRGA
jgi:signal transduction histidine kinase